MRLTALSILLAAAVSTPSAPAATAQVPKARPDLADVAAGIYEGSVVADARGSSGAQIIVTVKKVARNMVEVSCDYARVPTVRIGLIRASDAIMNGSGHDNFLIQQGRDPRRLDLSIDGVTMIVRRS